MKKIIGISVLIASIFVACRKDKEILTPPSLTKAKIDGISQKGPFLNGSSVSLYELDENLAQTGKSFNTQILDNLGSFELDNISIQTPFVKIKVDGFYFNEINNSNSASGISLYALTDLSDKSTTNVNLLSTLETSRTEYLVNQGLSFSIAKQQAQTEILDIFSIQANGIPESELLDISKDGDDNAILLAVSIILQGYKTEAELSQLLGDISTDIRTDGILNSPILGTTLINDASLLSLSAIRDNLENKYLSLGVNVTIPDFELFVNRFIDSTSFVIDNFIEYPYIVNSKENLLKDTTFQLISMDPYSLGAYMPKGTHLKVVAKPSPGYINEGWGTLSGQNVGWTIQHYGTDSLILIGEGNNQINDCTFLFGPPSSIDFFIYENNATIPTRIKTIVY